jgi:hypothetical protein
MVEDPVDHGARGNERDDPHLGAALGAPQRIDLEDLSQQLGPPPPRFPQRERHRLGDGERGVSGTRALVPRPAHAIGVVAVVALGRHPSFRAGRVDGFGNVSNRSTLAPKAGAT